MAKLLVQESTGVREFELVDAELHIGRELDNALRLSDPSISRHHAIIRRAGDGYELQDLQSSNGVLVNGTRVQTSPLVDGDRVTLGQVQMTFVNPQPTTTVGVNPLGTVRLNSDEVAKLQAAPGGQSAPLQPPAAPQIALDEPPPAPQPAPRIPPPAPAPTTFAPPAPSPAPGFLQGFLPPSPDDAVPTGERGDFFSRLVAFLLDWVVIFVITLLLHLVPCLGVMLAPLVGIAYTIFLYWCLVRFRATFGKKVMKLRVVPVDDPYGHIDASAAVLRFLGHLVNSIILFLPYLLIFGSERKGLQDIFSKSIVIKVDR